MAVEVFGRLRAPPVQIWILDGGCFVEYLYVKKYTFGRENIYYLLSFIHYLLSNVEIYSPSPHINPLPKIIPVPADVKGKAERAV